MNPTLDFLRITSQSIAKLVTPPTTPEGKRVEKPLIQKLLVGSTLNKAKPEPAVIKLSASFNQALALTEKVVSLQTLCKAPLKKWMPTLRQLEIREAKMCVLFDKGQLLIFHKKTEELTLNQLPYLGDKELSLIGRFSSSIDRLNMSGLTFDDETLQTFPLETVEGLFLAQTKVSDATLELLAKRCKHLLHLDLSGTSVTMAGLSHVAKIGSLRTVRLVDCPHVPPLLRSPSYYQGSLIVNLQETPSLEELTLLFRFQKEKGKLALLNCHEKESLERIFAASASLESLVFDHFSLQDETLATVVAEKAPQLRMLLLTGPISAAAVTIISTSLTELRCLVLKTSQENALGDEDMPKMPTLSECALINHAAISVKAIEHIIANCSQLRTLMIRQCPQIGEEPIKELQKNYPHVRFSI